MHAASPAWIVPSRHERTLRSHRRRCARPDRPQAAVAGRAAGKLHRADRGGRPARSTRWSRATTTARARTARVRRSGGDGGRRAAAAARSSGRHQGPAAPPPGCRTTWGSPIFRDHVPERDDDMVARHPRRGRRSSWERPTRRNGAPARTRATRSTARREIRSIRKIRGRVVGRLGRRARDRHGAALHRQRHRRLAAQSRGVLRHRRLSAEPRPRAERNPAARLVEPCRRSGRWRAPFRTSACCSPPWCPTTRAIRSRPPSLADGAAARSDFYPVAAGRPLQGPRGVHARLRICADRARRSPRSSPTRPTCSATFSPRPRTQRRTAPAPTRPSRSFARWASSAAHLERVRTRPDDVGPNVRADVEAGLRFTATDVARAEALRTAALSALADFLRLA